MRRWLVSLGCLLLVAPQAIAQSWPVGGGSAGWLYVLTAGNPNDPAASGAGQCTAGTGGKCACGTQYDELALYVRGSGKYETYFCATPATDSWALYGTETSYRTTYSTGEPNAGGAVCITAGDRYIDSVTATDYYCTDAGTGNWIAVGQPAGTVTLKAGTSPAQNYIPAFSTVDGEVQPSLCTFSGTLDGIDCDAGATGQALRVREASGSGSDSVTLEAPTTLDVTRRWVARQSDGKLPRDATRAPECIGFMTTATIPGNIIRFLGRAEEALNVVDVRARCTTPTDNAGVEDCSAPQVNVYSCPATGDGSSDVAGDCTARKRRTAQGEWGGDGLLTTLSGSDAVAAGEWYGVSLFGGTVDATFTVCVTMATAQP